jgi:hypothetical protein
LLIGNCEQHHFYPALRSVFFYHTRPATMLRTTMSGARAFGALRFSPSSSIRSTLRTAQIPTAAPIRSFTQRTLNTTRSSPKSSTGFTFTSNARPSPSSNILNRIRSLRFFHNTRARRSAAAGGATEEPTTLGGRLKKLSREYGWSALGVYLMLSALDFPFCYLLVRTLGTDRIGEWDFFSWTTSRSEMEPRSVLQIYRGQRTSARQLYA